jgi:hypothetical protein
MPAMPDNMDPCGRFWYRTRKIAESNMQTMTPQYGDGLMVLATYFCYR